jgi:hypothetical protein
VVKFLGDQSTQRVEAIVTIAALGSLCFQKFLGRESPRPPFFPLGDHRLASVLEPLDGEVTLDQIGVDVR